MAQPRRKIPAVFIRGGTSKGVFFHEKDLPREAALRDAIFLDVLGSPDPYQRQLDGMGGGISSLSKAVIIAPSTRGDADIDYTFAQISVDCAAVDYSATCGNLSSAVGPFAVDEGLVEAKDGEVIIRVFNTNTDKIYHARFYVEDGQTLETGDFMIPGVASSGAPIALDYMEPGGATARKLLPTGNVRDRLNVKGAGSVEVSLVDATSAVVYVAAADMGCTGSENPDALDADRGLPGRLDAVRRAGAVAMGIASRAEDAPLAAPRIAMVAPPVDFQGIDGKSYSAASHDLTIRIISMGRCHKAVTLTGAMCTGVAVAIEGTIPHALANRDAVALRLGNPSGALPVEVDVVREAEGKWHARRATVYRTQRRLMEGRVLIPSRGARVSAAAE